MKHGEASFMLADFSEICIIVGVLSIPVFVTMFTNPDPVEQNTPGQRPGPSHSDEQP
jgi:hypothetical protein